MGAGDGSPKKGKVLSEGHKKMEIFGEPFPSGNSRSNRCWCVRGSRSLRGNPKLVRYFSVNASEITMEGSGQSGKGSQPQPAAYPHV